MEVSVVKALPIEEAFAAIREKTLESTGDQEVYFYRDAQIRLADFDPDDLNPVALYLLEKNLETQRRLHAHLLNKYNIDTLSLSNVIHLQTPNGIVGLIPPYVEISEEEVSFVAKEGDRPFPGNGILRTPLVLDGLHRTYLAREMGKNIRCIVVRTPNTRLYPPASYPVEWSQVKVYDSVPQVKKHYRRQDPYTYMRPLDALRLLETSDQKEYGR